MGSHAPLDATLDGQPPACTPAHRSWRTGPGRAALSLLPALLALAALLLAGAAPLAALALFALQHRGQESAGIAAAVRTALPDLSWTDVARVMSTAPARAFTIASKTG